MPWVRNTRSVQAIDGSENHDMLRKGSYLLSAQVLVGAGRGQELVPGDNVTVAKHLESWEDWFVRYFRFHARQGLQVEISSPGYNEVRQNGQNFRSASKDAPLAPSLN